MAKKDDTNKQKVPYLKPEVVSLSDTGSLTGGTEPGCLPGSGAVSECNQGFNVLLAPTPTPTPTPTIE
jgi:hypothetical protein